MPLHGDGSLLNAYLLLPLSACVTCAMLTVAILARDVSHRANRIGAVLTFGAVVWSFCEVLWNTSRDPDVVLRLVRISAIGWVGIGPLGLHLFLELTGQWPERLRRAVPWLYGVSGLMLIVALTTPWMHAGVVRTAWGWGYVFGPAYPLFYAFTVSCLLGGIGIAVRDFRDSPSPGERSQARWLMVGIAVPLVVASVTDGFLPFIGHQVPRLGTASFTVLGATFAWGFYRYGYSLLAPGAFAPEILDTLPDGVALLRLDGRVRSVNGGMSRLLGAEADALEGARLLDRLDGIDRDPMAELEERECTLHAEDGSPLPVSVSSSLLRDKQQNPIGLVLVVRDLREVTSLRNRLVTSDRLAAVGQLAAGIAHEINNPIAFVRANLGSLRKLLESLESADAEPRSAEPLLEESQELIEESLEGVDRVASIVRDVKGFSHAGDSARQMVDLNQLLDAVLRVAAPQLRYAGRIERCYGEVPPVRAAPQELKQVFLNLVINASQAVQGDEAIRITTAHQDGRVVATVEDEGCGIPPGVIGRIFDPFFTTKPVGEGTGLGLAISYQIVRSHGGELQVDSQDGRGTVFRVELPAAAGGG